MKLKNFGYAAFIAAAATAFVLGGVNSSEAKGKKKAPAAKPPASCMFSGPAPVCATRGGMKFTYRNACYAGKDGAKVVAQKACPAPKAKKAKKGGKKAMKKAAKKPMMKKPMMKKKM